MEKGQLHDSKDQRGKYILIRDEEDPQLTMFDKPLPFFGCGIGWCSLLLGFMCPLMWYYAAALYFFKYYRKDPRERVGLAAAAVAAFLCTVAAIVTLVTIVIEL